MANGEEHGSTRTTEGFLPHNGLEKGKWKRVVQPSAKGDGSARLGRGQPSAELSRCERDWVLVAHRTWKESLESDSKEWYSHLRVLGR